jgi:hypothetical protein
MTRTRAEADPQALAARLRFTIVDVTDMASPEMFVFVTEARITEAIPTQFG